MNKPKPIWKIALVLVSIAIAVVAGFVIYNNLKSANLIIMVTPLDATITINGTEYKNGTYTLFPSDNAKLSISRDGYKTKETNMDIASGSVTLLYMALEDENGGFESYLHNAENYDVLNLIAQTTNNEELLDFTNETNGKIDILSVLPIDYVSTKLYKDSHGFFVPIDGGYVVQIMANSGKNCGILPCLSVYEWDGDYDKAKTVLKKYGYNLDDYEIEMDDTWLFEPNYLSE